MSGTPEKDPVAAIRTLYFRTTAATIERDLRRAIALFRTLGTDAERERAAAFMDGLSQLRSEWAARRRSRRDRGAR